MRTHLANSSAASLVLAIAVSAPVPTARAAPGRCPKRAIPPLLRSDFEKATDVSLRRSGQRVAVVCYSPPRSGSVCRQLDTSLASQLTRRLTRHSITAVEPKQIGAWLEGHPEWTTPSEMGTGVGARFIIRIDVEQFVRRNDSESNGQTVAFRATVRMVEVHSLEYGSCIYSNSFTWNRSLTAQEKSASNEEIIRSCCEPITERIGRLFYAHLPVLTAAGTVARK